MVIVFVPGPFIRVLGHPFQMAFFWLKNMGRDIQTTYLTTMPNPAGCNPFGQKTSGAAIFGQPNWRRHRHHRPALLPRSESFRSQPTALPDSMSVEDNEVWKRGEIHYTLED